MSINTLQLPTYPAASGVARVFGNVALRIADVFRAYKNRRAMAELAHLDERMLRDIGLTRGDLRDAISEPLWRDPTNILVKRSHERRITRTPVSAIPAGLINGPSLVPSVDEGSWQLPARSRYY